MHRLFTGIVLALLSVAIGCGGGPQQREQEATHQSDFHYQLAVGHYHAREAPIAIRELLAAIELDDENIDAIYILGYIYQGRRDYVEAERLYRRALEIDAERYDIRNSLGTILLQKEMWEEAEDLFRGLTRVPTYVTPGHAHNNLGWALFQQRRYDEAIEQFEMAIMFQPELCQAYNNQGMAEEELQFVRQAMESYEDAIERCTNYAEPRYRLGAIYWQMGDVEIALELFEECVELEPNSEFGDRCWEYVDSADGW